MSVKQAILDFTDGETRNRVFVTPDIPSKKLSGARSQFVFRDDEVIVLYDDTVFGSGKDGFAITEEYIYSKQLWETPKSIKISSIRNISSQSKSLNNLEIYFNNTHFITLSSSQKDDHPFIMGILKSAKDAAAKPGKKQATSTSVAEPPARNAARPAAKPKGRSQKPPRTEVVACNECSAELPNDAKFCLECGSKVMPKGVCLECSAKLPEQARFCPECGTPAGLSAEKPVQPKIDVGAIRRELKQWLSAAENVASIDNDGDLALNLTASAPSFAKDLRGWVAQYDIRITSEGVTEQVNNDSASFGRGDEFSVRSPYCRVGKLSSAAYEMAIKLHVYTLQELEVHEIVLKDGALSIPKLASSRVKIKSLTARLDDDGSYGVEYELEAYPNHVVHFDVLTEKPDEDAGVWARVQEEATHSGTSWLWEVKPGRKIYVCFGEYKSLVDGIEATFSGRAEPDGGAYGDADEADSTINLSVGSVYRLEPREKNNFKEIIALSYGAGKTAYRNRIYRSGAINLTIADNDELVSLQDSLGDDYFSSSEFSEVELDHCFDLLDEEWEFENDRDRLRFEPNDSSEDLLEHLEANHGFEARSVHYEFIEGGFSTTPIDGDGRDPSSGSSDADDGAGVDWRQAADRAFNVFFNAIRKGEDTDTAAEWFRGEIAEQTEAAGNSYDYGWEQEITPAQLQIISDTVANRLKGLNEEQGYEVSSDFYQGFIASFSNIIYNRSQEGGGDFGALQTYWDQTIGNELPEECGTRLAEPTASASENDRGLSLALKAFDTAHDPLIYDPEDGKFPALNYWRDNDLESFIDNIVDNSSIGKNRGSDFYKAGYEEEFGNGWVKLRVVLSRTLSEDEHKKFKIHSEYPNGQLVVFEVIFDSGDYDPEKPSYLLYVHIIGDGDSGEYWGFWYQTNCGSSDPRDSECFEEMMGDVEPLEGERSDSDAPTTAPHANEGASVSLALQQLAERTEISLTASGRLARYFRDCDNLYTSIIIEHGPENFLKVSIVVETDGQADDLEEAEEAIGDYIFDAFLTAGLIEIFGEEGYEDLEFDNHFKVKSLEDRGE